MNRSPRTSGDLERLDDYVREVGAEEDTEAYELDLFTRALDDRAHELLVLESLVGSFRRLAERGTFMSYISEEDAAALRARYSDRLAYLEVANGTECQRLVLPRNAEVLLTRCAVDLRGVDRVDLEAEIEGVGVVKTMPDVTFDRDSSALWVCCEMDLARQTVGLPIISKYWGFGREGRRLIGMNHVLVELG